MDQLKHRKAHARLRVMNADKTPASNVRVSVDQISHRFLFGCGAFDAVEMMKTQDEHKRAFLRERMEKWLKLFNYGTLPFYWGRYEPEEGHTAYDETIEAARWLRDLELETDGEGYLSFDGFKGNYTFSTDYGNTSASLNEDFTGDTEIILNK